MECILTNLKYGALAALTVGSFAVCVAVIAPIVILVCCVISKVTGLSTGGVARGSE